MKSQLHAGAVRGLAWHPTARSLLASGGGSEDGRILVSSTEGSSLSSLGLHATDSQVTQLAWSPDGGWLLSLHGYSISELIGDQSPPMLSPHGKITKLPGNCMCAFRVKEDASKSGQRSTAGTPLDARFEAVFSELAINTNSSLVRSSTPPVEEVDGWRQQSPGMPVGCNPPDERAPTLQLTLRHTLPAVHQTRPLHLALRRYASQPDRQAVVTAAGGRDASLRFWEPFATSAAKGEQGPVFTPTTSPATIKPKVKPIVRRPKPHSGAMMSLDTLR